jgi:spore germination cell wall hydrolase CwlJ-like protein
MKKMIQLIVSIIALTVMAPGHAETSQDVECLARNIFYEAGSEPEEGKVAVGIVTLNRVREGFGRTICEVVYQRTQLTRSIQVQTTRLVKTGWFSRPEPVAYTETRTSTATVCQFSWACANMPKPKMLDNRWRESKRIAQSLVDGDYEELIDKYSSAMYFHSYRINPTWARQKIIVSRVGGHVFYSN